MVASKKVVLTDRFLRPLKPAPAGKRVLVWDAVQPHLGVRITDSGRCTFVVVKRRAGHARPAARCRVISDVESQVIDRTGINAISSADLGAGKSDYHPDLLPALRVAALKAYEDAGQPGGCAFWQQNPAAVVEMRRLAALATSGP